MKIARHFGFFHPAPSGSCRCPGLPPPIVIGFLFLLVPGSSAVGQVSPRFVMELEAGPVWQTRNEVQIPNDATGSRFSLEELAGRGPWLAARLYLTWNINYRHGLQLLLAPLEVNEAGTPRGPISFAGAQLEAGVPLEATYRFNSWRLGYRYRLMDEEDLDLFIGFTAKLRDAKVSLRQGEILGRDTDLGFVPLFHASADWELSRGASLLFDFDGLAGGPGRAFDAALKLAFDLGESWRIGAGYRTLEGGADVDAVYNFAWLHYGVISLSYVR